MAEDIGLFQNTIVRAPFKELWKEAHGIRGVLGYYWNIVKHKGTAIYSRYYYRSCIQKTGWTKYLPVDPFNNTQYKVLAQRHYKQIYECFATGNVAPLEQICLTPLVKKLKTRIAARGNTTMEWQLHKFKSARVMSHRAAPLGEDTPDTAYRQVVVRLESVQSLTRSASKSKSSKSPSYAADHLPWVPDAARQRAEKARQRMRKLEDEGEIENEGVKSRETFLDNGVPKTVVEYLVLQKRVIRGSEEDWKVWGFAEESTPRVLERDERYWARMLDVQAAGAA
jgi:protein MBA1